MSGISSGIGLISGINTAELIDQLMAIERRPIDRLQERITALGVAKTAFLSISAHLLAMRNTGVRFSQPSFFSAFVANSSNEDALTVTAQRGAAPGTYAFRVHALATNHQVVSRGFCDADSTPVGVGRMTFEGSRARVNPSTELATLNGGAGVRRGLIRITDRSGASAEIDLTFAQTIDDVLRNINSADGVNVRARVTSLEESGASGDRIVVEDLTGSTVSNLIISDVGDGSIAADLGIAANVGGDRVDGGDLVRLDDSTPLALMNDGNGVDRFINVIGDDIVFEIDENGNGQIDQKFGVSLSDDLAQRTNTRLEALNGGLGVRLGAIRITDRAGHSVDIDLDEKNHGIPVVQTVDDVIQKINTEAEEAGVEVSITVINAHFQVSDNSGAGGEEAVNLKIEDVNGFAAADLGIAADVDEDSISGTDVYRVSTLGDVIRAINLAEGNAGRVTAAISDIGNGITLKTHGHQRKVTVKAGVVGSVTSWAAADLGILTKEPFDFQNPLVSRDLVAGLNTVLLRSLNGGAGVEQLGLVGFTDRAGASTQVDLSGASTLQDVIDLINTGLESQGVALTASINAAGHGIALVDESGGGGSVEIKDIEGSTAAADLGIAGEFGPDEEIDGGNLQRQYVARSTPVSELNNGRGVTPGDFRITAADGTVYEVSIGSHLTTVGQIIDTINAVAPDIIIARINDTGDGILIEDKSGGEGVLTIEDVDGGTAAADLRIAGSSNPGDDTPVIDGSYEIRIEIDANDTLNEICDKIKAAGGDITASVINTGGGPNPFSLTISSDITGRAGEMIIDTGGVDLGLRTMARAQDALVTFGADVPSAVLISSSTNTLDNVIKGVTINLLDVDDEEIIVTIEQDIDGIVSAVREFVDDYNDVQGTIDEHTHFDPDTFKRGVLFSDSTVNTVRTRLYGTITRRFDGVSDSFSRLSSIGLNIGANNRLEFNEERFREAYDSDPDLVEQLFTLDDTGFGDTVIETLDGLTDDFDGVITRKNELLSDQQDLLNDRIDLLNTLIERKRARLERQFTGLESSLAELQRQQNALLILQAQIQPT